jgi:drug/metabolite transporter (DMT)-like permease
VVSVMVLSYWVFNEPVTPTQIVGAIAIVAGIVCLAFAEGDEGERDVVPA